MVRSVIIRTALAAAILWVGARIAYSVLSNATLPEIAGLDQALSTLTSFLAQPLAGVFAAIAAGYAVEQTGVPKALQDWFWPPLPAFLRPLPRVARSFGRTETFDRLNRWLRAARSARALRVNGLFGPAGVGKTHVALDWLHRQRQVGWHVGELQDPVPLDWAPKRPTLVYVDYEASAGLMWRSLEPLAAAGARRPVGVLIDGGGDFDILTAGLPSRRKAHLATASPPVSASSTAVDGQVTEAQLIPQSERPTRARRLLDDLSGRDTARPIPLGIRGAPRPTRSFVALAPLAEDEAERFFARLSRRALRPSERPLFHATVEGRAREIVRLAALVRGGRRPSGSRAATALFDPGLTRRADAEALVHDAIAAFPEDGLNLLILAALGRPYAFSSRARTTIAPGASDQARLARLFRHHEPNTGAELAPRIADAGTAVAVLIAAFERIATSDVEALAMRLAGLGAADDEPSLAAMFEALTAEVWAAEAPVASEPEEVTALLACLVHLSRTEAKSVLAAAKARFEPDVLTEGRKSEGSDRSAHAFVTGLDAFARFVATSFEHKASGAASVARILDSAFLGMAAHVPAPASAMIWNAWASHQTVLKPELSLIAASPAWRRSNRAQHAMELLLDYERTASPPPWLCEAFGTGSEADAASTPPDVDAVDLDPTVDDAYRALTLMDQTFRAPSGMRWSDEDTTLIARLLTGKDPIGQLFAAWAVSWRVRPTDLGPPDTLTPEIQQTILRLVESPTTPRLIWKRAAASVAKQRLGAGQDPVLSWARWLDGEAGEIEALVPPDAQVPVSPASLDRCRLVLGDADAPLDVRRSAALLLLSAGGLDEKDAQAVADALKDAVLGGDLAVSQKESFVVRLASLPGRAAGDALATIVRREAATPLGLAAFIALAWSGRARALDFEDLTANGYGPDYLKAWLRLVAQAEPAEAAETESEGSAPRSRSFAERVIGARGHLIHKMKAKDTTGRWAYYFILVTPSREREFLNAIEGDGNINLLDFGEVVASSYGETPSPEIVRQLKERYDLDVT